MFKSSRPRLKMNISLHALHIFPAVLAGLNPTCLMKLRSGDWHVFHRQISSQSPDNPTGIPATAKFLSREWGRIIKETTSSAVTPTSRSQPKDYQNDPVLFYRFTVAGFLEGTHSVTYYRVYCFSPHRVRNVHHTALPIHIRNWTTSRGELQPSQPQGTAITS